MPLKMFSEERKKEQPRVKHIIAVAAGKGGVGKSTVTANLARALHWLGFTVGVMDTDIYGPSIRKMLPESQLPAQNGQAISPALCQGISVISMAFFRKESESSAVRAPIANSIITQFIKNVAWGNLDYLLIDFPPGTGDIQLTLSQQANLTGAILVTTPQEVAVMDVRKAMHLFDLVQVPIVGIVENMSYYLNPQTKEKVHLFGQSGGERLARDSGVPFLGGIPIDASLCKSGDTGVSIFDEANIESKESAEHFLRLARQIVAHVEALTTSSKDCLKGFELIWQEMK